MTSCEVRRMQVAYNSTAVCATKHIHSRLWLTLKIAHRGILKLKVTKNLDTNKHTLGDTHSCRAQHKETVRTIMLNLLSGT